MKDGLMLIGEIADFFGVSRKAMRLYEKKGIIKPTEVDAAKYKEECLDNIINNVRGSEPAEKIAEMTEDERAWLLVKMVCIEDVGAQMALSEALWV